MKKWKLLLILILIGMLTACAAKTPDEPFTTTDLSAKLGQGYKQKVDNTLIVLDASTSMFEKDPYEPMSPVQGEQKLTQAKNTILRMNEVIAPLKLQAGLHVFGPTLGPNFDSSKLVYGMTAYKSADLKAATEKVAIGGLTPLAKPFIEAPEDLKGTTGKIAMIIFSDGKETQGYELSSVAAAEELKKALGDRLCIYTVLLGTDPVGKKTMEDIAAAGQCGFATTKDAIFHSAGMVDFTEQVFLEKEAIKQVKKTQLAPPPALPVQYETARINLDVQFDFDKDTIRPREADQLDEFAKFMKIHPQTNAVLEGHTDNVGSKQYNMDLSIKRANAVKNYLVFKLGISASRLTTKGYGIARPIASNKIEAGRQKNRRVMADMSATVQK